MDNQFSCSVHAPWACHSRMMREIPGLVREQFIKRQRRGRIFLGDVLANGTSILPGFERPE
jgi:hypothetical protein